MPSVCLSLCFFCLVFFFFFRVTSTEVARLSLSLKHTLSLFLVSFYFLLVNNIQSRLFLYYNYWLLNKHFGLCHVLMGRNVS